MSDVALAIALTPSSVLSTSIAAELEPATKESAFWVSFRCITRVARRVRASESLGFDMIAC